MRDRAAETKKRLHSWPRATPAARTPRFRPSFGAAWPYHLQPLPGEELQHCGRSVKCCSLLKACPSEAAQSRPEEQKLQAHAHTHTPRRRKDREGLLYGIFQQGPSEIRCESELTKNYNFVIPPILSGSSLQALIVSPSVPHCSWWPLSSMAPLAHTLALLAMTVATAAIEVLPLDMAENSFDDQYRDCRPAMTAALPALNHSEFQENPVFALVWTSAMAQWQSEGSHVSPLSSPAQAIAITAFTPHSCLHGIFNIAVRVAGRSPRQYQDKFQYKTLHFLLTDALATLRDARKGQCLDVVYRDCGARFEARRGDTVRFGEFFRIQLRHTTEIGCPDEIEFEVHTCHGAGIPSFSQNQKYEEVVIPPFETFEVTEFTWERNKTQIQLRSTGTYSKYNCEWLKGGSIPSAPFHLGGLLLATTALAVATGII
ncbi:erythroblast NAD(P)(+)--arginine ADP-ribosyltransferase-like [Chamaea fasciata]|uniref:erythroblast NAD(P)(+)--arginine ADP-ribosyltransferase-like n=1 Tax=Chamaea fasciata TaxID=190680 RepID=UPI003369E0EF